MARVVDDRPHAFLDHPAFDVPDDLLALFRVGFGRLLVDQRLDLGVAIAGVVARRFADIALVEDLVGIIDRAARQAEILAHQLRDPVRGLDGLQLAVDADRLQLVDQDRTRIPISRDVAR